MSETPTADNSESIIADLQQQVSELQLQLESQQDVSSLMENRFIEQLNKNAGLELRLKRAERQNAALAANLQPQTADSTRPFPAVVPAPTPEQVN